MWIKEGIAPRRPEGIVPVPTEFPPDHDIFRKIRVHSCLPLSYLRQILFRTKRQRMAFDKCNADKKEISRDA